MKYANGGGGDGEGVQLAAAKWAISNVLCTVLTPPPHPPLLPNSHSKRSSLFGDIYFHLRLLSFLFLYPPVPPPSSLLPSPHMPTNEVHQ